MSITTVSAAGDAAKPKRAFRRRYSVARGNAYQLWGLIINVISTIVTTRNPTGDYGKALQALRS